MARALSMLMAAVLTVSTAIGAAPSAHADIPDSQSQQASCTHTFTAANGASWSKASSWTPASIPNEESVLCLNGRTITVPAGTDVRVATIQGEGATLVLNGSLTISHTAAGLARLSGEGTFTILAGAAAQLPVQVYSPVHNHGRVTVDQSARTTLGNEFENYGNLDLAAATVATTSAARILNATTGQINADGGTIDGRVANHGNLSSGSQPLDIKNLDWAEGLVSGSVTATSITALSNAHPVKSSSGTEISVGSIGASSTPLVIDSGAAVTAQTVLGPVHNHGTLTLRGDSVVSIKAPLENHSRLTVQANASVQAELDNYGVLDIGANTINSLAQPLVVNHANGTIAANGGAFSLTAPLTNFGKLMGRTNGLNIDTLKWHAGEVSGTLTGENIEVSSDAQALKGAATLTFKALIPEVIAEPEIEDLDEYLPAEESAERLAIDTSNLNIHALTVETDLRIQQLRVPVENTGSVTVLAKSAAGVFAPVVNVGDFAFESGNMWRSIDADITNQGNLDLGTYSSYKSSVGAAVINDAQGTASINGTSSIDKFSLVNHGHLIVGPGVSTFSLLDLKSTSRTTVRMTERSFTPLGTSSDVRLGGSLDVEFLDGYQAGAGRTLYLASNSKSVSGTVTVPAGWDLEVSATDVAIKRLAPELSGWSISGTTQVGNTLKVEVLGWNVDGVVTSYQWLRDGVEIAGATGESYAVTAGDAGTVLSVQVAGVKAGFAPRSFTARAGLVTYVFDHEGAASVRGSARVGESVRAVVAGWVPAPTQYTYQWLRDGAVIVGATNETYVLTSADRGKRVSVRVMASHSLYTDSTVISQETAPVVQTNVGVSAPKISGTARIGKTLSASTGTYAARPTSYTYQWLRNGKAISGATKSTYKLVPGDGGRRISVKVTARRSAFTTVSHVSKQTSAVVKIFTTAPTPTISGTIKVGSTLRVKTGTWKPYKPTYSYRWLRNGKAISGATKSSYKLTKSDAGKKISVKVVAKRAGYLSVTKYSKSSKTVR